MTDTPLSVAVLAPLEFRFLDPADQAAYTDRWYLYDESAILRLPARKMLELEQGTGYSVRDMLAGVRAQKVIGDLLATWTAVHLNAPELAGEFAEWGPLTFCIEWRVAELDDLGKDDEPLPEVSETTPTVALPSLPAGE